MLEGRVVDPQATFRRTQHGDLPALAVTGELDLAVSELLQHQLRTFVDAAASTAVVDLSAVSFIDSSCVDVLVRTHKYATEVGREVVVSAPSPAVRRVLTLTGVDQVLTVRD